MGNGNNPAEWQEGTPWQDNLGALFTHTGQSETIYSTSAVDTTISGTMTLDYWAVIHSSGAVLHITRDVVMEPPTKDNPQPQEAEQSSHDDNLPVAANDNDPATTTAATSTAS
jgi:hypothetical protein